MKPGWICLPAALLAAFVGTFAAPLAAPAHAATAHAWNDAVTLRLPDGRAISGRYRGMLGWPTDPATYADRYESWRQQIGADAAPALGETLTVTCRTGAAVSGPFRGLAGPALLLGTEDSCVHLVVPLEQVQEAYRALEPGIDLGWAARSTWPEGPSTYVTALWVDGRTLAVPVVEPAATAPPPPLPPQVSGGAGPVILGVLVGGAIVYIAIVYSIRHAFDNVGRSFGTASR